MNNMVNMVQVWTSSYIYYVYWYTLHYNTHMRICSTHTYVYKYICMYMYTCICEYSISLHYNIHTRIYMQHTYICTCTCTCSYVSTVYHCYRKLENSCGCGYHVVTTGGSECCHTTSSVVRNSKKEKKTQEREFARRYVRLYYKYGRILLGAGYIEETGGDAYPVYP